MYMNMHIHLCQMPGLLRQSMTNIFHQVVK